MMNGFIVIGLFIFMVFASLVLISALFNHKSEDVEFKYRKEEITKDNASEKVKCKLIDVVIAIDDDPVYDRGTEYFFIPILEGIEDKKIYTSYRHHLHKSYNFKMKSVISKYSYELTRNDGSIINIGDECEVYIQSYYYPPYMIKKNEITTGNLKYLYVGLLEENGFVTGGFNPLRIIHVNSEYKLLETKVNFFNGEIDFDNVEGKSE